MDDIGKVLSVTQLLDALLFYKRHKRHIDGIIKDCLKSYPPSQIEDKNDVRIWKPEYWKWFVENY